MITNFVLVKVHEIILCSLKIPYYNYDVMPLFLEILFILEIRDYVASVVCY